jgi:hypothetical protein
MSGRFVVGVAEVSVVLVVLVNSNSDNSQTVAVLGLIYAAIRFNSLIGGVAMARAGAALDLHFYELRRIWDQNAERPHVEATLHRCFVDYAISGAFLGIISGICIYHFFRRL